MKKRTRAQWLALFVQHDGSGVSATEFCKDKDLCPKYFSLRRKQLAAQIDEVENGFVQIKVKAETKPAVSGSQSAYRHTKLSNLSRGAHYLGVTDSCSAVISRWKNFLRTSKLKHR